MAVSCNNSNATDHEDCVHDNDDDDDAVMPLAPFSKVSHNTVQKPGAFKTMSLLLQYNARLKCSCFQPTANASAARDLLMCARSRSPPTFSLFLTCNSTERPFVLDDAVWGFSLETLQNHVSSASFIGCLHASIDLVFVNTMSSSKNPHKSLMRLGTWEALLTHFIFVINTNLSGQLEVAPGRISYRLPIFNKGGSEYTLVLFICEDTEACCCKGDNANRCSVRWDLVCSIAQRQWHEQKHGQSSLRQSTSSLSQFSSVLYAASWSDDALVDACVLLLDERSPIVAFLSLAHTFIAMGVPKAA